jgi:hypothetical protein
MSMATTSIDLKIVIEKRRMTVRYTGEPPLPDDGPHVFPSAKGASVAIRCASQLQAQLINT